MSSGLKRIIENHDKSLEEPSQADFTFKRRSYAVSNLRGGIGKSTLSFNLSWMFTRHSPTFDCRFMPTKESNRIPNARREG